MESHDKYYIQRHRMIYLVNLMLESKDLCFELVTVPNNGELIEGTKEQGAYILWITPY